MASRATQLSIVLIFICWLIACKKSDKIGDTGIHPQDSVQKINKWILDSMKQYYYWSHEIQPVTSLAGSHDLFFKSLLFADDLYSSLQNGGTSTRVKSCFENYGFDYILLRLPSYSDTQLLGVVTYVARESQAERIGLKRGLYFSKVNGQRITESTVDQFNQLVSSGSGLTFSMLKDSSGIWTDYGVKKVSSGYFENRPIYTSRLFEFNGKRTGYIYINSFSDAYDKDISDAFFKIKNKGINELIIDLRYNRGGNVSSVARTCLLIGNIQPSKIFGIYEGNDRLKEIRQTFEKAITSSSNTSGTSIAELISISLKLKKIYILSSSITASAAELLINNLKPYLQVVHIGEKTFGKDMGSMTIEDNRDPMKVSLIINPIVFKLYNALHQGDYSAGLDPTHLLEEYSLLPLKPLGDPGDVFIRRALELIYGTHQVESTPLQANENSKGVAISSIIYKSGSERNNFNENLIINIK